MRARRLTRHSFNRSYRLQTRRAPPGAPAAALGRGAGGGHMPETYPTVQADPLPVAGPNPAPTPKRVVKAKPKRVLEEKPKRVLEQKPKPVIRVKAVMVPAPIAEPEPPTSTGNPVDLAEAAPSAPARLPVPVERKRSNRDQVICRPPSSWKPAPPPARRSRPKPDPRAAFSPEFLEQLERVAKGAPIAECAPIRKAPPAHTLGGVGSAML